MGSQKRIPAEAVDLYTQFIHGEVSRRDFLSGVQRFAVGGLTAAAIVEALMPNYALGQQVSRDDYRITATYETVPSPDGNGFIRGYLVRPFSADSRSETMLRRTSRCVSTTVRLEKSLFTGDEIYRPRARSR